MSFSKSVIKKVRSMSKNELVDKVFELSNYAEHNKAMNLMLQQRYMAIQNFLEEKKLFAEFNKSQIDEVAPEVSVEAKND